MPSGKQKKQAAVQFKEVLPQSGMLYTEDCPSMALCKPKIMPLKSVTLEKLEKMQKDAQEAVRQQDTAPPVDDGGD